MLRNEKVAAYFQTLDLDVHEGATKKIRSSERSRGVALFHLLDNGDGEASIPSFYSKVLLVWGSRRGNTTHEPEQHLNAKKGREKDLEQAEKRPVR